MRGGRTFCIVFFTASTLFAIEAFAQPTTRVSVDPAGGDGNARSGSGLFGPGSSISPDGRYVAFAAEASNFVPGDTNGVDDVFVRDRLTGTTVRVSVDSSGAEGNGFCFGPSISADGRFVAFMSEASNLVPGDTNGLRDVFVHDGVAATTVRVNVDSAGNQANADGFFPVISADGRFVAFQSEASNLVPGDTNAAHDIFVHDLVTAITTRVSVATDGTQGNGFLPSMTPDGRFVAFYSIAPLVAGDTNADWDVYIRDLATSATTRVSVSSSGIQGNSSSWVSAISGDGGYVAFESDASNLVAGDTNGDRDIFVRDRIAGTTTRVNVSSTGIQANGFTVGPTISADGRFVGFYSFASNLVPADTNSCLQFPSCSDVFVHDRATATTSRVSLSSVDGQGNGASFVPAEASNLVPGDGNGVADVFVRQLRDPIACRPGTVNAGAGAITDVLFVNGSAGDANRIVTVPLNSPIDLSLDGSPSGPGGPGNSIARYVLWVWFGPPINPTDLAVGGTSLGCTANPSPFSPAAAPQAIRCLRGTGVPASACGSVPVRSGPARAPWSLSASGRATPITLTIQGAIQDNGAANALRGSVTNAVILRIE
jgi:hypothetical protein